MAEAGEAAPRAPQQVTSEDEDLFADAPRAPEEANIDDGGDDDKFQCQSCDAPDHEGADEQDAVKSRILPDPGEPTDCQREEHRASGHIPYRSWCPDCVGARGTGEQHRTRTGERRVCVFSFDYLFLDKAGKVLTRTEVTEGKDVDLKILVAKDSRGKATFMHVVPQKGVDQDHYAVDALVADVKWLGFQRVSLRSDNERAIVKLLQHALTEARFTIEGMDQAVEEHPNTYDSAGNGEIEATAKQLTGILRSNKFDLER